MITIHFLVFLSLVNGDDVVSDDESAVTTTTATVSGGDNSTDVDEDAEPLPRAARYTRNELPLLIIRPVNGVAPNQKPGSVYITTGNRGIYIQPITIGNKISHYEIMMILRR